MSEYPRIIPSPQGPQEVMVPQRRSWRWTLVSLLIVALAAWGGYSLRKGLWQKERGSLETKKEEKEALPPLPAPIRPSPPIGQPSSPPKTESALPPSRKIDSPTPSPPSSASASPSQPVSSTPSPASPSPPSASPSMLPGVPSSPPETLSTSEVPPSPKTPSLLLRESHRLMMEGNLLEAKERLKTLLGLPLKPEEESEALYRLGLLARKEKNESEAMARWEEAYQKFPTTVGGRLSAYALAETWYPAVTGPNPQTDRWESVRNAYSVALGMDGASFLGEANRAKVEQRLTLLNQELVFGPLPVSGAIFHTVDRGDAISTIGAKYGVNWTLIAAINRIEKPYVIRKGQKLKILKGKVTILVEKHMADAKKPRTANWGPRLTWYLDGIWIATYPCCVGEGNRTPAGRYVITRMDIDPDWRDPEDGKVYRFGHPKNIIGSRWMALEGMGTEGLGIHGTTLPESIPGYTSKGCIRLLNKDVEVLYGFCSLTPPLQTEVLIRD